MRIGGARDADRLDHPRVPQLVGDELALEDGGVGRGVGLDAAHIVHRGGTDGRHKRGELLLEACPHRGRPHGILLDARRRARAAAAGGGGGGSGHSSVGREEGRKRGVVGSPHELKELGVERIRVFRQEERCVVAHWPGVMRDGEGWAGARLLQRRPRHKPRGLVGRDKLAHKRLGRARLQPALFVKEGKGTRAAGRQQLDHILIVLVANVLPRHALGLVLGLLEAKGVRVELLLQHFVLQS